MCVCCGVLKYIESKVSKMWSPLFFIIKYVLIQTAACAQLVHNLCTTCAQFNFTRNEDTSKTIEIYRYGETTMMVTTFVCIHNEQYKTALRWTCRAKQTLCDSNWPVFSSTKIFILKSLADVDGRVYHTITIKLAVCLSVLCKQA